jgi:hypothetical protein
MRSKLKGTRTPIMMAARIPNQCPLLRQRLSDEPDPSSDQTPGEDLCLHNSRIPGKCGDF